jgi:hypothetical protein
MYSRYNKVQYSMKSNYEISNFQVIFILCNYDIYIYIYIYIYSAQRNRVFLKVPLSRCLIIIMKQKMQDLEKACVMNFHILVHGFIMCVHRASDTLIKK